MAELISKDVLPTFAVEEPVEDAERAQLIELFAKLSALAPAQADPDVLARGRSRLLATVSAGSERWAPLFGKLTRFFDIGVGPLRALLERAAVESEWQAGPLPWVSLFHFTGGPAVAGFDTGFVRIKKGMPFPAHRHQGREQVLILDGGYHDDAQRWWGPGELHVMTQGSEHSLHMNPERDVLLAVILTDQIEVLGSATDR